jgi:hypothetical protein
MHRPSPSTTRSPRLPRRGWRSACPPPTDPSTGSARRYGTRIGSYPFPKGDNVRQEWTAEQVGRDGFTILEAVWAPQAPAWLREVPAVQVLRRAWVERYHRDGEDVLWGEGKDLPPGRRRALLAL